MEDNHSLTLSADEMRALGYRVVDMLVAHFEELAAKPVTRKGTRAALEAQLREPLPQQGVGAAAVLDQLERDVLGSIMHLDHPRFFAFVPGPSNFIGAMADALASGFNVYAGTWLEGSAPAQIELTTVDWLREACGLPDSAGGLFVSGGSMANITALAVARHVCLDDRVDEAVVYYSDQTHSSVDRGLWVLGFQEHQLRKVPSDASFRLDLRSLRKAIGEDRAAGRKPFCVVANAGTTNTGAIDPLVSLADICQQEDLWLHIDGAYGAAAVLCARGQSMLEGLGRANSVVLDPHKWLFQPYEIGCVLVRDRRWLRETFHILPEYLEDLERGRGEINFCDLGIQLTRSFRALKLWMSLKTFGRAAFEGALERGFGLAETAQAMVGSLPDWEVVTPAQLGVVTFCFVPQGASANVLNRMNRQLVAEMIADGYAMISSTVLRGKVVLRMCTINPRTTDRDVTDTLRRLDSLGQGLHDRG